jgi:hypothetical protein
MRYLYAVIWVGIFGTLGWMVYTGEAAEYTGRKGRLFADMLNGVTESIGAGLTGLLVAGIGFGFAAWAIWGKEDGDDDDE